MPPGDHEENLTRWEDPEQRLRQALEQDELALFCQPIAALQGAVRFPMAEVLIRLREEEMAMLPPGEFLPVFEHHRLMPALDRWVVRKVLLHVARGSRIPRFAINLSTQTVEDADFPGAVAAELKASGVQSRALLFEITESDVLAKFDAAAHFSKSIHALGCETMVSGFGRRAVTFAPLKMLGPAYVKIDGVITRKILSNAATEAKLRSILRVGEVMGYQTIAEMVEEQDTLVRLKALGVAHAQGFGIQQPHPIERLAR